jgi:hypothetical protein
MVMVKETPKAFILKENNLEVMFYKTIFDKMSIWKICEMGLKNYISLCDKNSAKWGKFFSIRSYK